MSKSLPFTSPPGLLCSQLAETCMLQRFMAEAVSLQELEPFLAEKPQAEGLVARILGVLRQNNTQLSALLDPLHAGRHRLREAGERLSAMFVGCLCKRRSRDLSAMLRDDYALLNLVAMNYTILHTSGLAMRDLSIASLALGHLQQVTAILQEIVRLMASLVMHEISGPASDPPVEVEQRAFANTQAAWRNSVSAA